LIETIKKENNHFRHIRVMTTKVNVYNIQYDASDDEIVNFMALGGAIKEQRIKRVKDSHRVTGEFIYYDYYCALNAVQTLNKQQFKGREL
jgi:hypothetical protein